MKKDRGINELHDKELLHLYLQKNNRGNAKFEDVKNEVNEIINRWCRDVERYGYVGIG